jgi:hypothetical protein
MNYRVPDLGPVRARLAGACVPITEHGVIRGVYGAGPVISCRSPAGFRIEVQG